MAESAAVAVREPNGSVADIEDTVLHNTLTKTVSVLGKEREIRPLPGYYARKLGNILHAVNREWAKYTQMPDAEKVKLASPLGGAEEIISKALCDGIAFLGEFYGWQDDVTKGPIQAEQVDKRMTSTEWQDALQAQADLNGKNDFLLVPLRVVSQSISNVLEGLFQAVTAPQPSSPGSASSGASAPSS